MASLLKSILIISFTFFLYLNPGTGYAQETDAEYPKGYNWDRFSVSLGGFIAGYNSGITFASKQLGLGVQIDVEDALGLKSSQLAFRGGAVYKFGKTLKHSVALGYFGITRSSKKTLEEELEFGDEVFPIGTEITSSFDLTILRTKYDYSFFQDDRVSLGASFGLFIMPVNLKVKAASNQENITQFTAPLPLLGLRSDFKITEKLFLYQSVELLYLSVSDFTGSILDLKVGLEHKTFKHFAFGIGVNSNRINMSIRDSESSIDLFGDIRMDYTGLLFYGKYYF